MSFIHIKERSASLSYFLPIIIYITCCRYLSHFRSIHRGAYFAELRTTTVRKLLPESWGFLCPVHTPDGSPCGLLNHLTTDCRVVTHEQRVPHSIECSIGLVLDEMGLADYDLDSPTPADHIIVMIDGKIVGTIRDSLAPAVVAHFRTIKAAKLAIVQESFEEDALYKPIYEEETYVPSHTEIIHIPFQRGSTYPGLFIYTQAARLIRPVRQIHSGATELIGAMEQHTMNIRCADGGPGGSELLEFTHEEFSTRAMLSVVASLTPYSDFNQSPRNMYQCQMAKQTMGTAAQALMHRTDNKLYRLQTPQNPITRTDGYKKYEMEEFPNGANAVVAVIAYTGFDMEDAMILNKSSVERGFAHASMYKTETINLREEKGNVDMKFGAEPGRPREPGEEREPPRGAFGQMYPQVIASSATSVAVLEKGVQPEGTQREAQLVDSDGLPHIGSVVWPGQVYYGTIDRLTGKSKSGKLKGEETASVEQVAIIGDMTDTDVRQANIKLKMNRNPVIGDKFSSRHGQKGVLSKLYDDIDMPYCEKTGMRPDLLINPHAFPSRMTIGMLIESLTGKSAAMTGKFVDASPFQSAEEDTPIDPCEEFATALEKAGFARNGGEVMISGTSGEPFHVDIYVGVVYYQRLRHMVSDKFQVRSIGPLNPITRQPIKGRKFGGGIRFGEMERDSLLAHGAAYLLHDRLHSCSDYEVLDICSNCGCLVSTINVPHAATHEEIFEYTTLEDSEPDMGSVTCKLCGTGQYCERLALPSVFKYLATELAAMNIRCVLDMK